MVTYSDSLSLIYQAMMVLLQVYKSKDQDSEYLKAFLPRVIYLMRFFFEHNNFLNPVKVQLYDYFQQDPHYALIQSSPPKDYTMDSLYLEIILPNNLTEPYDQLTKNQKHSSVAVEQSQLQVIAMQDIKKHFHTSSYHFALQIVASNPAFRKFQDYSPLHEIIKLRVLFALDHQTASHYIVKMNLLYLELYLAVDAICQNCPKQQEFLDHIFQEKMDFQELFTVYSKLFQLQNVPPDFHTCIVRTFDNILSLDTLPE